MANNDESKYFIRDYILYKSCTRCSQGCGKDVFYPCPEFFGLRYHETYSQSICTKCRGKATAPNIPYTGYTYQLSSDKLIPNIVLYDIEESIYPSLEGFNKKVIDGHIEYQADNIEAEQNSFVMLRYKDAVVAYGLYDKKKVENNTKYYEFFNESFSLISAPIKYDIFQNIISFRNVKISNKLSNNYLPKFLEIINENIDDSILDLEVKTEKRIKEIKNFDIIGIHEFKNRNSKLLAKDYITAQANKTSIGEIGEKMIYEFEKHELEKMGLVDLANKVKIVSEDTTLGYDVLSYNADGSPKHIEVKSKAGNINYLDFFITDNELTKLKANKDHVIYHVTRLRSSTPFLFKIKGEMLTESNVKPVLYRVSLNYNIIE